MLRLNKILLTGVVAASLYATAATASVTRVTEANFEASAGLITFSEFSLNTINPTYAPANYGGGAGSPTVTFGGFFQGQSLSATPGVDCPGAAASACVVGTPTGALSLDASSPDTFITTDGSNPTSPVLSGNPRFNGPIAVLFSEDQFGVGFDGGFFNAANSTAITAFARDGSLIGSVENIGLGIEFLGLVSATENIAGVFLDLVGAEPFGFAIDNIRFGRRGDINPPTSIIPLPAALPMFVAGLGVLGIAGYRRRKKS
ncbi:hypothetical protein ABVF61_01230 [Roseibium sp. HPY-6]|uniref:hypothetical protein n=1 Tax=Roseibium sp. HPY-6 TaxID=3229852 RepID=UPI00338DFCFC